STIEAHASFIFRALCQSALRARDRRRRASFHSPGVGGPRRFHRSSQAVWRGGEGPLEDPLRSIADVESFSPAGGWPSRDRWIRLVVIEKIVNQPGLLAIDGHHGATAARVEGEIHPGWLPRKLADQLRRTEIR